MKILFYRYNSICEPAIISAFQHLGHEVTEITEEIYNKQIHPQEIIKLLMNSLQVPSFHFVFSINFYPVISEVCNIFKIPYVCWIVDSPFFELYSDSLKNPYNRVFLFDKTMYEEFSPVNTECIFYLPLACNIKLYDKVCQNISDIDFQKFSSDISFVGSLYSEKCPYNSLSLSPYTKGYCDGLIESQLKIYGYNFLKDCITEEFLKVFKNEVPDFYVFPEKSNKDEKSILAHYYLGNKVSEQERIRTFSLLSKKYSVKLFTGSDTSMLPKVQNCGTVKTNTEMPLVFHLSKINLNITTKPIQTGLPLRIFDIMGCGGFLLSNYQLEIPDYFNIGEDLDLYTSMEELEEKVEFYLTHEKIRKKIAQNGYRKVKEFHSYEIRLSQMLEMI